MLIVCGLVVVVGLVLVSLLSVGGGDGDHYGEVSTCSEPPMNIFPPPCHDDWT
jgi:hypothetical protein